MRETANTKAIILNRRPFREHDTQVILYSENYGKLELIARGTKKLKSKLSGHLEPITLSEIMIVPGKQFDYIGTAEMTDSFFNIKSDLDKLLLAGKVIKIFGRLVKEAEKDVKLFAVLFDFLKFINRNNLQIKNKEFLYSFFVFKLLSQLGYKLDCHKCSKCGELLKNEGILDYKKGEIKCKKCTDFSQKSSQIVLKKSLRLIRLTYEEKYENLLGYKVSEDSQKEYCNALNLFFQYNFF